MKHNHFLILFMLLGVVSLQAQVSTYTYNRGNGGVFPYITATGPNVTVHSIADDIVSPAIVDLPFGFTFGNASFSSLGISENGFVWFGPAQPHEVSFLSPISSTQATSVRGIISAMGIDLHPINIPEAKTTIKSAVLGVAPNRIFVIEWAATSRIESLDLAAGPDIMDFQIRLSEGTNALEIVYGRAILNPNVNSDLEVGLKTTDADFNIRTTNNALWSNTLPGSDLNHTCTLSTLSKPAFGQRMIWSRNSLDMGDFDLSQVVLYPIPARDNLIIQGLDTPSFAYTIHDMTGRLITQNTANDTIVSLDGLASGNYVVTITTNDFSLSRKFVKI